MSTTRSIKPKVYILSGAIHTGKSTALYQLCTSLIFKGKQVHGLINPSIDGNKWFIDLKNGERFKMEESPRENSIRVGRYIFSEEAFMRAREIILDIPNSSDLFIIDEIGKLELEGKGLEPAISRFTHQLFSYPIHSIILVVRDFLLKRTIEKYALTDVEIISVQDLKIEKWI